MEGDSASMRFLFAKISINERNRELQTRSSFATARDEVLVLAQDCLHCFYKVCRCTRTVDVGTRLVHKFWWSAAEKFQNRSPAVFARLGPEPSFLCRR